MVPFCCTLGAEWITVMDVINVHSMLYHCIQKKILSGDGLPADISQ